eukprot:ANDGO_06193.mRNA.1 hypothetical protein
MDLLRKKFDEVQKKIQDFSVKDDTPTKAASASSSSASSSGPGSGSTRTSVNLDSATREELIEYILSMSSKLELAKKKYIERSDLCTQFEMQNSQLKGKIRELLALNASHSASSSGSGSGSDGGGAVMSSTEGASPLVSEEQSEVVRTLEAEIADLKEKQREWKEKVKEIIREKDSQIASLQQPSALSTEAASSKETSGRPSNGPRPVSIHMHDEFLLAAVEREESNRLELIDDVALCRSLIQAGVKFADTDFRLRESELVRRMEERDAMIESLESVIRENEDIIRHIEMKRKAEGESHRKEVEKWWAAASDAASAADGLRSEKSRLEEQCRQLAAELQLLAADKQKAEERFGALDSELSALRGTLADVRERCSQQHRQIQELERSLVDLTDNLAAANANREALLAEIQQGKVFSNDMEEVLRKLNDASAANRELSTEVADLRASASDLRETIEKFATLNRDLESENQSLKCLTLDMESAVKHERELQEKLAERACATEAHLNAAAHADAFNRATALSEEISKLKSEHDVLERENSHLVQKVSELIAVSELQARMVAQMVQSHSTSVTVILDKLNSKCTHLLSLSEQIKSARDRLLQARHSVSFETESLLSLMHRSDLDANTERDALKGRLSAALDVSKSLTHEMDFLRVQSVELEKRLLEVDAACSADGSFRAGEHDSESVSVDRTSSTRTPFKDLFIVAQFHAHGDVVQNFMSTTNEKLDRLQGALSRISVCTGRLQKGCVNLQSNLLNTVQSKLSLEENHSETLSRIMHLENQLEQQTASSAMQLRALQEQAKHVEETNVGLLDQTRQLASQLAALEVDVESKNSKITAQEGRMRALTQRASEMQSLVSRLRLDLDALRLSISGSSMNVFRDLQSSMKDLEEITQAALSNNVSRAAEERKLFDLKVGFVEAALSDAQNELATAIQDRESIRRIQEALEHRISEKNAELQQTVEQFGLCRSSLDAEQQRHRDLLCEVEKLQKRCEELELELSQVRQSSGASDAIVGQLQSLNTSLRTQLEESNAKCDSSSHELTALTTQLDALRSSLAHAEVESSKQTEEIRSLANSRDVANQLLVDKEISLAELTNELNVSAQVVEGLRQQLAEKNACAAETDSKISEYVRSAVVAAQQIQHLSLENENLKSLMETHSRNADRISAEKELLVEEKAALQTSSQQHATENASLRDKVSSCSQTVSDLEIEASQWKARYEQLKKDHAEAISSATSVKEQLQILVERCADTESKLSDSARDVQEARSSSERAMQELNTEIEELRRRLKRVSEEKDRFRQRMQPTTSREVALQTQSSEGKDGKGTRLSETVAPVADDWLLAYAHRQAEREDEMSYIRRELLGAKRQMQTLEALKKEHEAVIRDLKKQSGYSFSVEYLKNVILKFIESADVEVRSDSLRVISSLLQFSNEETQRALKSIEASASSMGLISSWFR